VGWFGKFREDVALGDDSYSVKRNIEAFLLNEQKFSDAFLKIGKDLTKMHGYYQQFEMMQGIIDAVDEIAQKNERKGTLNPLLSIQIKVNPIGKISVQQAFLELYNSIDRIHNLTGQEYFRI
jgi:hypothetical protein